MRKITPIFFLILISATSLVLFVAADFGESSTSLGQFTDEFIDLNNVSVQVEVERNATYNAMELNQSVGGEGYLNFTKYMEFHIDSDRVGSNLTDFPILLVISGSSGIDNQDVTAIFDEIGESYLKIAVTNTSMLSEYYIEVERWDSAIEIGILWISPDLSSLENTTLRLHYDSGVTNNTDYVGLSGSVNASNVWDAGFAAVYHMGSGTGNEVDSTGNGNTLSEVGTVNLVEGKIGYARDFLGSDDHFHFTDADLGIGAGQFTFESWFYNDDGDGRILYTYDPTSGIYVSTGNHLGNAFDIYGVIFVSGAATQINKGTRDWNDDTWYYVTFTRDSGNNLRLAMDTIQVGTGNRGGNIDGGGHGHIGNDISHTVEFDGRIDELRVSTTFRSLDWRNVSHRSGIDDLIYWNPAPFSPVSGFVEEGYFTTTDYLDYANGSILVLITNTTIPENTVITVELSEDNATWTLNDWEPIFGGYEAIDLRELNWSSACYLRYNLSTDHGGFTPRVYQSRLITTQGPEPSNGDIIVQESDFPWIAIAIILMCVAYLLARYL